MYLITCSTPNPISGKRADLLQKAVNIEVNKFRMELQNKLRDEFSLKVEVAVEEQ